MVIIVVLNNSIFVLDVTALPSPIQKLTASGFLLNASAEKLSNSTLISSQSSAKSSVKLEFCFWM